MRLAYLAGDRPDVSFAVKELARISQAPFELDLGLKRAVRHSCPRAPGVEVHQAGHAPRGLTAYSVTMQDVGQFTHSFFGAHRLRAISGTQKLVATSSAGAALYAGTRVI